MRGPTGKGQKHTHLSLHSKQTIIIVFTFNTCEIVVGNGRYFTRLPRCVGVDRLAPCTHAHTLLPPNCVVYRLLTARLDYNYTRPFPSKRMKTLLLVAAVLLYAGLVESFPNGAPVGACDTLTPLLNPMGHSEPPQTSPVPYSIDLSPFNNSGVWEYTPGNVYTRKDSVFVIHDSLADFQVHPLINL